MQRIKLPVILVTVYAFFYQLSPYMGISYNAIVILFLMAPVPVTWMVVEILKKGTPSQRTFDEYFYDDMDYKRNI